MIDFFQAWQILTYSRNQDVTFGKAIFKMLSNLNQYIKDLTILFFSFQWQFIFNIIFYWFQVHSTVVRESYTLQSLPPAFQYPTRILYSYHVIIDHAPNAILLHPCDCFVTSTLYFLISTAHRPAPLPLL